MEDSETVPRLSPRTGSAPDGLHSHGNLCRGLDGNTALIHRGDRALTRPQMKFPGRQGLRLAVQEGQRQDKTGMLLRLALVQNAGHISVRGQRGQWLDLKGSIEAGRGFRGILHGRGFWDPRIRRLGLRPQDRGGSRHNQAQEGQRHDSDKATHEELLAVVQHQVECCSEQSVLNMFNDHCSLGANRSSMRNNIDVT